MKDKILRILVAKYEAAIEAETVNLDLLLSNPVGIGDHSDFVAETEKLVSKITEFRDKLETLERLLQRNAG